MGEKELPPISTLAIVGQREVNQRRTLGKKGIIKRILGRIRSQLRPQT